MLAAEVEAFLKELYKTPADVVEATRKILRRLPLVSRHAGVLFVLSTRSAPGLSA
jgi:hypothetical protein